MKKTLSILLSFMLVFMSIGPLPTVFAAATINGNIAGEGLGGTGSVTVSGASPGAALVLIPKEGGSNMNGNATTAGTYTFSGVEPGIYTVSEKTTDGNTFTSNETTVTPSAVKVAAPNQSGEIRISGAKSDAELIMRHDRIAFSSPASKAGQDGTGMFNIGYKEEQVPPGKNYRVVQKINGVTSAESNSIDIAPERVRLNVTIANAGDNNRGGAIEVSDTRKGNRLFLHKMDSGTEPIIRTVEAENTYTFTGLSAGGYYVIQEEHGADSPRSNEVFIIDGMKPTIELHKDIPATHKVSMPKNNVGWVYPVSISDVIATDNMGTPTVTYSISPNQTMNTPDAYTITYTATDGADPANIATVTRTVIIAPPTLDIDENKIIHTYIPVETKPGRKVGDVFVNNVMAEATIKVYQDPGGKPIKTITRANDASFGEFKVTDIPVGKTYYITQTVNGIESETSIRVDIRDTTKPTIELNGAKEVQFVRGDTYIEYGATATDNVDPTAELSAKIVTDSSAVNMNVPGKYIVTYNVTDSAQPGNVADQVTRTVVVSPHAVIAIGSNADVGEVGVKNAFPGSILKLYNVEGRILVEESAPLAVGMTTHVFKSVPPGSYFVVQEYAINGVVLPPSADSNIVDVVDTNHPYITITGSENLFFVWDKDKGDYSYNKNSGHNGTGQYTDKGATAADYLDDNDKLTENIKRKIMYGDELKCDDSIFEKDKNGNTIFETETDNDGNIIFVKDKYGDKKPILTNPCSPILSPILKIDMPGVYTITYSVTTKRGTKADDKIRTITVAPPKVSKLTAESGKSTIEVDGIFIHAETILNLYNAYGQLIESQKPGLGETAKFQEIPAGLGYYVTQTVNGIESAPSDPVNVSLFENAKDAALITTFEFATIRAFGTIDQKTDQINIVVPKGTIVTDLKAKFSATGTVKVNNKEQISGNTKQDFTDPVTYTVTSLKDKEQHKDYTVTVTVATLKTNVWTTTVGKSVAFSSAGSSIALSAAEKLQALEKGVSFIGQDRAIHVPAANVVEANTPSLTVKTPATYESNTSDPAWSKVIQQPTEINWGNSVQPFMQPIEVEIPKPKAGKSFARIVRENNQLFAITQLSETQGDNMIGLATEPGTYAVIDDIAQPVIKPTTANGKTTYQITTTVSNAQIYYTTNSSHIAFDRSARRSTLSNYSLDGVPDFTNWNVYKAGEQIAAPSSGELYAFVMKDQIISPLTDKVTIAPTEWKKNVPTYSISHVLKVTFNTKVDRKALYSGMIYVVDDSTGEPVDTKLSLSADSKMILIAPDLAYTRGNHYTLHIDREFKGNTKDKQFLKQPLTQTFVTK